MATNGHLMDVEDEKYKAHPEDSFHSPFRSRYCKNSPLLVVFSETKKVLTWRSLWLWLAEAQFNLGLPLIKEEMVGISGVAMGDLVHD